MTTRSLLLATIAVFSCALAAPPALAGAKIFTTNTSISATIETTAAGNRDPFTAQIFTAGGECLRIAVTAQAADLEATLVSPRGTVWQDDDSNGANRPLIKAITNDRGWYPLIVSTWNGAAFSGDFTFTVQRAGATSVLCSPATPPRVSGVASHAAKSTAPMALEVPGPSSTD